MHVHLLSEAWNIMLPPEVQATGRDVVVEKGLFSYVANGVTTVQELFATPEGIALRQRITRGELLGPRLILARALDGPKKGWPPPLTTWVESAPQAREAVREAKAAGYDKIKVYSFLDRESYDSISTTARELGMDVIGHVPMSLSGEYVLDAGQRLITHSEEVAKHAGGNYSAERIDYFTPTALRKIWRASKGIPRVVNVICDNAMMIAFAQDGNDGERPKKIMFSLQDSLSQIMFIANPFRGAYE